MVRAACHCGAVRLTMDPAPAWVLDCNCSICRRHGALWAYAWDHLARQDHAIRLLQGQDAVEAYIWGDRWIGLWFCRTCSCVTHHTALSEPAKIRGVNARMFVDFDPARVTIHRSDNAHTGWFWSRPDAPVWEGNHPPLPPPGPDDWR